MLLRKKVKELHYSHIFVAKLKSVGRCNSVSGSEITEHLFLSWSKTMARLSVISEIDKGFDIEKEAQPVLKNDFTANGSFKAVQNEIIGYPKKVEALLIVRAGHKIDFVLIHVIQYILIASGSACNI